MRRNRRLNENGRMDGINARGHVKRRHLFDLLLKLPRILMEGNGVLVDDAEYRLVAMLDVSPGLQSA